MGNWDSGGGTRLVSIGTSAGTSTGTVLTGGAANAKGATPTQLVASTDFDCNGIVVNLISGTLASSALTDIMVGSAGNESVLIPDLLMTTISPNYEAGHSYFFPIFIAKGTRISARTQSSTASGTVTISAYLLQASFGMSPFSMVTAYGIVAASSRGTIIDGGGTLNTKPALPATELVASTARPIRCLSIGVGAGADYSRGVVDMLFDLYRGPSSGEYPLVENVYLASGTAKDKMVPPVPISSIPVYVPRGSRLSARLQANTITTGDRAVDIAVYGVD